MTEANAKAPRGIRWEAHVQTILIGLMTASVIGLVSQGTQMVKTQAEQVSAQRAMAESIGEMKTKLERMDARFAEFPSRAEAELRWRGLEHRVDEHTRRIERLEGGRR